MNMTDVPGSAPERYKVSYSQLVRDSLAELLARAKDAGCGKEFLQAAKEIAELLQVYPQFGEPLMDLPHSSGQIWHGTIGPLVVRYAIYEDRRLVMVGEPLKPLPNSGI